MSQQASLPFSENLISSKNLFVDLNKRLSKKERKKIPKPKDLLGKRESEERESTPPKVLQKVLNCIKKVTPKDTEETKPKVNLFAMKSFVSEAVPLPNEPKKSKTPEEKQEEFVKSHEYMNEFSSVNPFHKHIMEEMTTDPKPQESVPVEGIHKS